MNKLLAALGRIVPLVRFRNSRDYWETRYRIGGHSGEGSRGESATYKAAVINRFVAAHGITSAIEFGCGDGHQLKMLDIPRYTGVDVSRTILDRCRATYAGDLSKTFVHVDDYAGETAELAMSLDVIFHLVEDEVYNQYLARLFSASSRYVMVYSTSENLIETGVPHVRHRDVAADVASRFPDFERLFAEEAELPAPVRFDRGLPTIFMLYRKR